MKTGFKVADAMTTKPVLVKPETSLKKCAKIMSKDHVGTVLIGVNGKLQGILSEQDIVRKAVSMGKDTKKVKVKDIMETKLHTTQPNTDIFDAMIKMRDRNIRHLPVMKDKQLVGLLTSKDVLKIEPSLFDVLVEKIELREEEKKPINNPSSEEGICELCGNYAPWLFKVDDSMVCKRCKSKF